MENKSKQTNESNQTNQFNNTNEAQTPKVLKPIKRQKSRKAVFMGRGRNVSRSKDRSRNRSKSNSFKLLKLNQGKTPHPPAYPPPPPPPKPLSKELIQEHTFVSNSPRRRHNAKNTHQTALQTAPQTAISESTKPKQCIYTTNTVTNEFTNYNSFI